jgi:dTDP-4-dehydrorhamnose reductase
MAGSPVKAFIDRTVTPSFVPDVARSTRALIERDAPDGTYHCVNSGRTTWYDLAHEVAARLGVSGRIEPVKVADVTTVAPRPSFCALSNRKLLDEGVAMPDWQSAIARHVASRRAQTLEARA